MKASEVPSQYNGASILTDNLAERSNKPALLCAAREMTFGEVAGEASQVAHALGQSGAGQGDHVGILAADSPEWVATFFGTLMMGGVAVGLNTLLSKSDYTFIRQSSMMKV